MNTEVVRVVDFEELSEPKDSDVFYVVSGGKDHKLSLRTLKKLLNEGSGDSEPKHEW